MFLWGEVSKYCVPELFHINHLPMLNLPLGPPDPLAVITIDDQESRRTEAISKTQSPYWNEMFDLYDYAMLQASWRVTMVD